jgi:hypothetical protein
MATPRGCGLCNDSWICEDHLDRPIGHDGCSGAGMVCTNPECKYSLKRTGLVCVRCRRSYGEIEAEGSRVIRFRCRACSFVWHAQDRESEPGTHTRTNS